eukprot:Selendium_serpulae@DN4018_c0_g1_i3.p1
MVQHKESTYRPVEPATKRPEEVSSLAKTHSVKKRKEKPLVPQPLVYFFVAVMVAVLASLVIRFWPTPLPAEMTKMNDAAHLARIEKRGLKFKTGPVKVFQNVTLAATKEILGGIFWTTQLDRTLPCEIPDGLPKVPDNFNAKSVWPECFDLQSYSSAFCSASWAVAVATTIANRACIVDPENRSKVDLSPQTLLSCDPISMGCDGAAVDTMWIYAEKEGLVSAECFPFNQEGRAACSKKCKGETPVKITGRCKLPDKHYIMREIMANGPVTALVALHDDFLLYKNGIYAPTPSSVKLFKTDSQPLTHSVKIIGWGVEGVEEYWLIEGCGLGLDWGDNGVMKLSKKSVGNVLLTPTVIAPRMTKESVNSLPSLEAEFEEAERKAEDEARNARLEAKKKIEADRIRQEKIDRGELDENEDDDLAQKQKDIVNQIKGIMGNKDSGDADDHEVNELLKNFQPIDPSVLGVGIDQVGLDFGEALLDDAQTDEAEQGEGGEDAATEEVNEDAAGEEAINGDAE